MSRHADHCKWLGLETKEEGRKLLIRIRGEAPPGIDLSNYPLLINLYWRVTENSDHGMPSDAEMDRMLMLDDLLNTMDGNEVGFMMFSVTGNQRKEWIWYVKNAETFLTQLNVCLKGQEVFPIEIETAPAKEWSSYFDIVNSVRDEKE